MYLKDTLIDKKYVIKNILLNDRFKCRLIDLGFYKGNVVIPKYDSIFSGIRAYLINDSLIGIRDSDSCFIEVDDFCE